MDISTLTTALCSNVSIESYKGNIPNNMVQSFYNDDYAMS